MAPIVKILAACTGLVVFGAGFASSYGMYTPADLRDIDLCIEGARWGGSADYFGYLLVRCSTGDELETLSSTEVTFRLSPLPPDRLRYVFDDGRVTGLVVIGSDIEYRLERAARCFVQTKGGRQGMVGDCWSQPLKRPR